MTGRDDSWRLNRKLAILQAIAHIDAGRFTSGDLLDIAQAAILRVPEDLREPVRRLLPIRRRGVSGGKKG